MRQWYALRVRPRSEVKAADALEKGRIAFYLPRVLIPKNGTERVKRPLFPGYIFVHTELNSREAEVIRNTSSALGWVSFGDGIPSIPDEAIASTRKRVDDINRDGGLWERFKPGDEVRILYGRLDNYGKVLEAAKSPDSQVKVLLEFMGRMTSAKVPWESLSPLKQESSASKEVKPSRRTRGRGRWIRGFGPRAVGVGSPS